VISLTKDKDENIVLFPLNKIVNPGKVGNRQNSNEIALQQTKKFVETAVDDIAMNLLKAFVDLAIKSEKHTFTKDLALLIDCLRGLIYRDFGVAHPAQKLSDKMVALRVNRNGTTTAKLNYGAVLPTVQRAEKPLSNEMKEELKDLQDGGGIFKGDDLPDDTK